MAVDEDVDDVVDDHHFGEGFGAGEEVVLESVSKVAEDALKEIVCSYERGYIIAWCEGDGYVADILGSLYGIVEVGSGPVGIGIEDLCGGYGDEFEPVARVPPLGFHFYDLCFAVGIEDFVVEARVEPRIVGEEYGEDAITVAGIGTEPSAEVYALLSGVYVRDKLVAEDVLEAYVLYA